MLRRNSAIRARTDDKTWEPLLHGSIASGLSDDNDGSDHGDHSDGHNNKGRRLSDISKKLRPPRLSLKIIKRKSGGGTPFLSSADAAALDYDDDDDDDDESDEDNTYSNSYAKMMPISSSQQLTPEGGGMESQSQIRTATSSNSTNHASNQNTPNTNLNHHLTMPLNGAETAVVVLDTTGFPVVAPEQQKELNDSFSCNSEWVAFGEVLEDNGAILEVPSPAVTTPTPTTTTTVAPASPAKTKKAKASTSKTDKKKSKLSTTSDPKSPRKASKVVAKSSDSNSDDGEKVSAKTATATAEAEVALSSPSRKKKKPSSSKGSDHTSSGVPSSPTKKKKSKAKEEISTSSPTPEKTKSKSKNEAKQSNTNTISPSSPSKSKKKNTTTTTSNKQREANEKTVLAPPDSPNKTTTSSKKSKPSKTSGSLESPRRSKKPTISFDDDSSENSSIVAAESSLRKKKEEEAPPKSPAKKKVEPRSPGKKKRSKAALSSAAAENSDDDAPKSGKKKKNSSSIATSRDPEEVAKASSNSIPSRVVELGESPTPRISASSPNKSRPKSLTNVSKKRVNACASKVSSLKGDCTDTDTTKTITPATSSTRAKPVEGSPSPRRSALSPQKCKKDDCVDTKATSVTIQQPSPKKGSPSKAVAKIEPPVENDSGEHKSSQQASPEKDDKDQSTEPEFPLGAKLQCEEDPRTPSSSGGNRFVKRPSVKSIANEQSSDSDSDDSDDNDDGSSIRTFEEDNRTESAWLDLAFNDEDEQGPIKVAKPVVAPSPPNAKRLALDSSDSSSDSDSEPPLRLSGRPQGFASCSNEQQVTKRRPVPKKINSASLPNSSPIRERMNLLEDKTTALAPVASPGRILSPVNQLEESVAAGKLQVVPDLAPEPNAPKDSNVPAQRLTLSDGSSSSDSSPRPDDRREIDERTHQVSEVAVSSASPEPHSGGEKCLSLEESDSYRPHEEVTEPAPAPVKRLSLDDTDSESSDDEPPISLTGRPGGLFSSQQGRAAKRRPPPPSKAASKTLENVVSLKDRMKFLNATKSVAGSGDNQDMPRRTASLMVSPSRGAGSTNPRFQELKRLAMKAAHEIASDDENGDSMKEDKEMPRRSASLMYSPTKRVGATITTLQQVKEHTDDREGDKDVVKVSLPHRRNSTSMVSPSKGGATNSRFQELMRLAMKAAHEIDSDDEQ